ncbi:MAG: SOS response-associated peptidase [Campylobacterota bacterium]|nr:SOS response-associated peptidase [Campylobacterota bacterium]
MPGRLAIYDDISFKEDINHTLGSLKDNIQNLSKRYNIAPTIPIPVYLNTKVYTYAHFGLIPSWAKDRSSMNINARCETIFEKKSFREAYKQRRCLIPVNGWYEWTKDEFTNKSIPNLIRPKNKNYFAIAGIYESWYDNSSAQTLLSCALITTEPNGKIAAIHDRMPVILEQKDWKKWLDPNGTYEELNDLFKALGDDKLEIYETNHIVNSVRNDSPACIENSNRVAMVQGSLF